MPFIENPPEPLEHQCFIAGNSHVTSRCVEMVFHAEHPEELAQIASAGKRARAEVQIKDLTQADRKLFEAAKDAELSCWLQTSALKPVLRKHLNPEQIPEVKMGSHFGKMFLKVKQQTGQEEKLRLDWLYWGTKIHG